MHRIFRPVSFVLFILLLSQLVFAQNKRDSIPGIVVDRFADTSRTTLKLPNHFIGMPKLTPSLSSRQLVKSWVFQQRNKIWSQVQIEGKEPVSPELTPKPFIDWRPNYPLHTDMSLDYRESSLFVPVNVRDYIDFKMGRYRYIPLASLATAGYLADRILSKYGPLLQRREQEKYLNLEMSDRQILIMDILWKRQPVTAGDWYAAYNEKYSEKAFTFLLFKQDVASLEGKFLIKSRKMEDDRIQYYPAVSREELVVKLKDELEGLDAVHHGERMQDIRHMLDFMKNL